MIADGPSLNRPPHIWLEPPVFSSRLLKSVVLGLAFMASGCDRQSGQKAQQQASASASAGEAKGGELTGTIDRSHKGSQLPDYTLTDASGKELQLKNLKGKPFLINLWATWCAPCIAELPTLNAIANRANMNVRVVTISQDLDEPAKVQQFLDQHGFAQLPGWVDTKGDLAMQYGAQTLPTSILYDAQGREVWRFVGGHDWSNPEAQKLLTEADS
jgi:thiol-disulfide isomerase/thioredoxin